MEVLGFSAGASVGFYQGNVKLLTEDIATLRPTLLAGVPRVWNRIYDKIQATIAGSSWLKRSLFETAYENQVCCSCWPTFFSFFAFGLKLLLFSPYTFPPSFPTPLRSWRTFATVPATTCGTLSSSARLLLVWAAVCA